MSGLDPFEGIVKEEDSTSAESRFSLDSNDIFDFEEDAVRVRSQNIMGEKSLASQRASGQARVYSSRGFSQSSKEAQKLVTLLKDFDNTPGKVQLGVVGSIKTKKFRAIKIFIHFLFKLFCFN